MSHDDTFVGKETKNRKAISLRGFRVESSPH